MMYWDNHHMSAGWGFVMMMGMLAIWILIALAIARAMKSRRVSEIADPADGAKRILAERLARGEIEPDDYQTRLTALK